MSTLTTTQQKETILGTPFTLSQLRMGAAVVVLAGGVLLAFLDLFNPAVGLFNLGTLLLAAFIALAIVKPTHAFLIAYSIFSVYIVFRVFTISMRTSGGLLSRDLGLIPRIPITETINCSFVDADTDLTYFVGYITAFSDSQYNYVMCPVNYVQLFIEESFMSWIWNTGIITVTVSLVGLVIAATSAYAFSRWAFPGRRPFLVFLLTTQMIPAGMLLIPIYVIVTQLRLQGNLIGLMLAYITTTVPFSIWVLKGYYDTIPPDLEEAAMVDGCNRLDAFWRVIIPLSTPALSIVFLFNFLGAWSEYIVANIIIGQVPEWQTWSLGFNDLIGTFNTDWGKYAAGSILVTVPIVLLFMSQSKYLIGGLTVGGVKG